MKYASWGRLTLTNSHFKNPSTLLSTNVIYPTLPVGNGRSYGDQGTNHLGTSIDSKILNKFVDLDLTKGEVEVQSGVLLRNLNQVLMLYGKYLPVVPGTELITVGGAIANDVHGKNHHVFGSFGSWVNSILLRRSDGSINFCSPDCNKELFFATIGGCGLTGFIESARLRIVSHRGSLVEVENLQFSDIQEFLNISQESASWESHVGWLNMYKKGSGILTRGNRIDVQTDKSDFTFSFPKWQGPSLINTFSSKLISYAYHNLNRIRSKSIESVNKHYFPLDAIDSWNFAYGKSGFFQYQFVVPTINAVDAINEVLKIADKYRQGSFVNVLKVFGNKNSGGLMSFPMPGITFAMDFPNQGSKTLEMLNSFDRIIAAAEGRLYLAKDARMAREFFESSYPNHANFQNFRDPMFSSDMSRRLMGW